MGIRLGIVIAGSRGRPKRDFSFYIILLYMRGSIWVLFFSRGLRAYDRNRVPGSGGREEECIRSRSFLCPLLLPQFLGVIQFCEWTCFTDKFRFPFYRRCTFQFNGNFV